MVRSHWLALAACPALLILTVAPFGCSSDASEDGSTRAADAGPTEDADVPDVAETPEDTNAAGGLTATAIDFGDVNCGTAAPAQTFAITNPSTTGYIRFTATLDEGGDSPFVLSPSTGRIGPGERQIVTVTPSIVPVGPDAEHPTPTGKNGRGDHVTIVAGTSGLTGAFGVDLLQTARGAVLAFASPGIDFMSSPLAAGTVSQSFGVRNTGNVDATVGLTLTGDDVFGLGAPSVVTSAGGQPATALATFKPTAEQAYSGAVAMSVGADVALCAALPAEAFTLTGAGVGSVVGLSTTALLFGVTDCGTIAAPQTVTVTNYGASSFKITSLRLTKGNDVVYDTPTASPAITTPVAPNGGATSITIAPREISSTSGSVDDNFYGDTLTITTDVVGDTPHTVDLRQSARGVIITRAPVGTVTFGDIGRGNTGKRQVTYANVGNVDVTFNVTHPSPHFTAPAQISIGKGSSATATLVFTPPTDATVNTGYTDSLTFARTDTKVPICQTIATTPLHGSGIRPVTTVFPTGTQAYGSVNCGTTPGTKTLTYTNNGPAIHWTAAFATGTQYTVSPASGDLAAGGSVDLTVTPNAVPTNLTSLSTISDNLVFTPGGGQAIVTNAVQVTPAGAFIQWLNNANGVISSYNYGSITTNASATYNFGIKNVGTLPATFNFTFTAASSSAYTLGATTSTGGDVATSTSFSPIPLTFKPTAGATFTGTLVATSTTPICNAQITSAQLALTGAGK